MIPSKIDMNYQKKKCKIDMFVSFIYTYLHINCSYTFYFSNQKTTLHTNCSGLIFFAWPRGKHPCTQKILQQARHGFVHK